MTAEIAVMNKLAVALAADSKVTVRDKKTYDTANKLFAWSSDIPVGIMIYGNAEFHGFPWETLIKHNRSFENSNALQKSLKDYVNNFWGNLSQCVLEGTKLKVSDKVTDSSSGIVFAGFGKDEFFPTVIECKISNDGLSYSQKTNDLNRRSRSCVIPFAQTDMIEAFMDGYDSRNEKRLHGMIAHLPNNIKDKDTKKSFSNNINGVKALFDALKDKLVKERHDEILQSIASLPKDELANVAESLINLTTLRRRVSQDMETVGGEVDVAVISKGDGLVWIKRKHYFDAKLNSAFISRYKK